MLPGDLELDALFEDHGVSWLVIDDLFVLNFLSHFGRDATGASYVTLPPLLISRTTVRSFLFSSWTSHRWSESQDNNIHVIDVLSLAATVYICIKMNPAPAQGPQHHARQVADLLEAIARLLFTVVAHRVDNSANWY